MRTAFAAALLLALAVPMSADTPAPAPADNPLLTDWTAPFGMPPFDRIQPEHFLPAFRAAIRRHDAEIAAIVATEAPPTLANTVVALDDAGEMLTRVNNVFGVVSNAETNEALQAVEEQVKSLLAAHADDIWLNEALFRRVKAVYDGRDALTLKAEEATLLAKTYRRFVRGGANLGPEQKQRLRAINGELSRLIVAFGANLLKETNEFRLVVESKAELAGLPDGQVAAAAEAAAAAGLPGKWVFTLKAPSIWPFLQRSSNRELRRRLLAAYSTRCDHGGATDNKTVFATIAALRAEKAQLLGYRTWADFVLDEFMAKTPGNVYSLMGKLWTPALARARREAADIQAMIDAENGGFPLEPADWRFFAERVKKAKYDFDEEAIRPYFPLDAVRDGAFALAGRLYGLTFTRLADVPLYHPEVQTFEVREKGGRHLGVLLMDFHPRPGKRGGAWCINVRDQWIRDGRFVTPIVSTVFNFSRPAGSAPALLTPDESETLFHEFGHALHSLFSACRFRGSGSFIAQDFVELPSQIMENWVFQPEMLALYARHYRTGEVIPAELVAKIRNSGTFNQGFAVTEVLAASLLDMDWHTLADTTPRDVPAFERASLEKWGLIPEILPRYRTTYFAHAADEYAAGYYSYTWSAVLDADAFAAFKETGNIFDQAAAQRFRALLAASGSEDGMTLYMRFRGREPKVDALIAKRGLAPVPTQQ
jgi:peptidyl-dipeptidase Dcp